MSLVYYTLILTILSLILIIWYFKISYRYWKKRQVPYLEPTIPYGNYQSFITKKYHFGEEISKYYQTMKSKGYKYCGFYLLNCPVFLPIDPDLIKTIMSKEFQYFSHRSLFYDEKRDPISAHLIAVNGKRWRTMRSKMTPAFSSGKIKSMFKIFMECGNILVKDIEQQYQNHDDDIDIRRHITQFTTNVIGCVVFGLNLEDNNENINEFKQYTPKAFPPNKYISIVFLLGSVLPKLCYLIRFRSVTKEVGDFFIRMVTENVKYREEMKIFRQDFLQILIDVRKKAIEQGEEFSMEHLAAQCFIFLIAGYETTTTTLAFILFEIARHPEVDQKLQIEINTMLEKSNYELTYEGLMEMKYLTQIIYESLRKYAPATYVGRICTQNFQVPNSKVIIEKGMFVVIPLQGIHYDSTIYPDPDAFDPDRFSEENWKQRHQYSFLPFGSGPRNCIGKRFAMLEIRVSLVMLLKKFKFSVSPKCTLPVKINPNSYLLYPQKPILLNYEKR